MAFSEEQLERYSRHFVLHEIGVQGQKRLLASKVLVIGAGALGSSALMYLAAAGIGTIGIADFDKVERSNLQRQIIHRNDSVGMDKVSSAKNAIETFNPDVAVEVYHERMTVDNIQNIIEKYDFIIDATDSFQSKFLINDACVLSEKPYSHAGAVRFEGQTMTYVPGQGPCLRCLLKDIPPKETQLSCSQAGVLGAVTGILGSIQAMEAVKYLLGIGDLLVGKLLHFDGLDVRLLHVGNVPANPNCKICGTHPTLLNLQDNKDDYEVTGCSS